MNLVDRLKAFFLPSRTPLVTQEARTSKRDPKEVIIKVIGYALGLAGNYRDYLPPEFDLQQITNAYNTEAYVRQAVDKYIELMFKSGWNFVGKNQKAVDYIKLRFACMAEATQTPTDKFFIGIAEDLVKYHNVIIAKARADDFPWPSSVKNVQGLGGRKPVVGYFPLNVTTMAVRRDKNGTIKSWQQEVAGESAPLKFKPENIAHIHYKREKGNAFGNPFLLAALEDIRLLRQVEENVARLIYRNLFPFYHYKVGTKESPAEDDEILEIQQVIERARLEDGLVTSERHSIQTIASDKVIDAHQYLKYFEDRVFTGLGVPAVMMGRGSTANRSTSDNQTTEFVDRVKAFQRAFVADIDQMIIHELLMEGGFDPILNPDDNVDFVFNEIDYDAKIKNENHAIFQYVQNSITENEMRMLIGRDPITDRAQMYMNLVSIPLAAGKAEAKGQGDVANRNTPTNQKKTKEEVNHIMSVYDDLGDIVVNLFDRHIDKEINSVELSNMLSIVFRDALDQIPPMLECGNHLESVYQKIYDYIIRIAKSCANENELISAIHATFEVNREFVDQIACNSRTERSITFEKV